MFNNNHIYNSINESKSTSMKDLLNEIERGDSGYVEKHKSIATVYRVMSGGKKLQVKLGKTGKKVVIDAKDIDILPESTMNERPRQLKDKNKEMMVVKDGNVIVIDKKDWKKYQKKGYLVAESVVNERKMRDDIQKLIKQKGYTPIFNVIKNSKRDLKQLGYSRGEIQDTLYDMFGDEDPKIVQKIKESVVNEAQKVPPQFISFLKMDYKNVKDTPRERKKLSKKLRKMPKDVLKQLADEDIGVLSSTSKELLGMSVAESVVNEASGEFVVYIERDNGRKKLLHTKKSQRAANMFMTKNMDKILNTSGIRSIGNMSKDQWEKTEARFAENIKKSDMKTITKKEWDRKHKDFKGIVKGQPYMMYYDKDTQSTVYGPVNIKESVNEGYTGNPGDKLTHKYDKNIEIELIEPTNKGWKVYQTDKGKKRKITYFDKQDIVGNKSIFESVNEGISVSDERPFGKKGIIILIDDNGKKVSAIFKDKKNADKYNRNNPSDIKKLLDLAKKTKYPNAIDESVNEVGTRLTMSKPQMKKLHNAYGKLTYDQMKRMMLSVVTRDKFIKSLKKWDKKSLQQLVDMQPNSPFSKTVQSYIDGKIKESVVNESLLTEATRSQVGIIDKSGNIISSYVHYDGYPQGVGKTLKQAYNGAKTKQLLKTAGKDGISVLDKDIKGGKDHSFEKPVKGQTIFYGRDRGDKGNNMMAKGNINNLEKYLKDADSSYGAEYVYLYDMNDNKWVYADLRKSKKELSPL